MMKALERMRGELEICENVGARPTIAFMSDVADEIERDVAERYMELPVDADGVLLKCGEEVNLTGESERLMVCGYTVTEDGFVSLYCSKLEDGRRWFPTIMTYGSEVEHVKPRTLEDVLRDVMQYGHDDATVGDRADDAIAKYADEIRELVSADSALGC